MAWIADGGELECGGAMKITSIAPWFGGKRTLAPVIVRQLGEHRQYFEPFCGSMAVLLEKTPSAHETVNDLHGDLVNLALVLQDEATAVTLYDRIQRTLFCEGLLEEAERILQVDWGGQVSGERAYWYFLASWMGRNGVSGTRAKDYQLAVRWTAGGGTPTVRFRSCTESIPAWHARLKNVVILNRDAFGIIPRFDDQPHVAIYVDPPYATESRGDGKGPGGHSGTYLHEFTHDDGLFGDDHQRLQEQLAGFRQARVVVSYYDTPRIRELYQGWTFIDCGRLKNLHQQNGRGQRSKEAPEVLTSNLDPGFPTSRERLTVRFRVSFWRMVDAMFFSLSGGRRGICGGGRGDLGSARSVDRSVVDERADELLGRTMFDGDDVGGDVQALGPGRRRRRDTRQRPRPGSGRPRGGRRRSR